jgi:hypothetical protein
MESCSSVETGQGGFAQSSESGRPYVSKMDQGGDNNYRVLPFVP